MRLQGRTAVVTGSSRGIAAEIAQACAKEGAFVVVNCNEDTLGADGVVNSILESGGKADVCIADVRNLDDVDRLMDFAVEAFGQVDILVNNAGISRDALLQKMSNDDWRDVIETNLTGPLNCARAASRIMIERKYGRIVNVSSVVAEMGNIGQLNYIASKAGVIGLTRGLALELAKYGVIVNAIAPGFCVTKMTEGIPDKIRNKILERIPLKRFADPGEIAKAAVFLASDECSYMTGQIMSVNGGLHL